MAYENLLQHNLAVIVGSLSLLAFVYTGKLDLIHSVSIYLLPRLLSSLSLKLVQTARFRQFTALGKWRRCSSDVRLLIASCSGLPCLQTKVCALVKHIIYPTANVVYIKRRSRLHGLWIPCVQEYHNNGMDLDLDKSENGLSDYVQCILFFLL